MDAFLSIFSNAGMSTLVKSGTAVLTTLLVVPMLLKLFLVTVDEGWAAIRTRNGKPIIRRANSRAVRTGRGTAGEVVALQPGTHGAFPMFYWYKLIDVRVRSTDLPARQLTGATGHQHLVHASFEWRPIATGRDLRVFELDVVNVKERAANIVGAALRDVIRTLEGDELPHNSELGIRVLQECAEKTLHACGVEVLSVMITGDALTDGHLLSQAMRAGDRHHEAVAALHALN
ncbi:SPFH domain-containing protein [Microbacterium tenebrionis]|uniref:SPFH domain-containing protein n=2 Tax=Microbacterium tenebrionis TaxID=2830665 RepID=UPI00158BC6AA|nr:SPFH domain-containing protein [Microbacterium ihumii]